MATHSYLALTGDIPGSRRGNPTHRPALQELLRDTCAQLSAAAPSGALAAALLPTGGDGLQTLLHAAHATHAMDLIQELTDRWFGFDPAFGKAEPTFPPLVFGVGFGPLTTGDIPPGAPAEPNPGALDGPCFHRAREALDEAKTQKVWARCRGFAEPQNQTLNALFDLMGAVRARWTSHQAILTHEVRPASTQKVIADARRVSPSVISEALKAARYREILAGESAVRALLATHANHDPDAGTGLGAPRA